MEHLLAENKALAAELKNANQKAAAAALGDVENQICEVKGMKYIAMRADGAGNDALKDLGDQLKNSVPEGVVVLASENDGKVTLLVMATDAAVKKGVHAGNLIKAIASHVGGGGGGKPQMAQAGGKNPAGIPDALAAVGDALGGQLS